jgi:hypothetical protein
MSAHQIHVTTKEYAIQTVLLLCVPVRLNSRVHYVKQIQTVTMPSVTTPDVLMACENQPCQNGGTCVPVGASYSCFCGLTSIYNGKNCDSTTPMTADECPLDCAPGRCIFSGNPSKPYACEWNGVMRPVDGTAS